MNYLETNVTGTKRIRHNRVVFDNPEGLVTTVTVAREELLTLSDGDKIKRDSGAFTAPFDDPARIFNKLDPATDQIVGTFTAQEYYDFTYSLLRALETVAFPIEPAP